MDRYVVAGNPVEHSQSPFIHGEFARQTGQAIEYTRVLWPLDGFAAGVAALKAAGVKGCNITVPFKFEAARAVRRLTQRAALAEAANILVLAGDEPLGDNTDGIGLVTDLERNAGVALPGARVLLIGAGGAAAGVLGPLLARQPAEITVANRTVARADTLIERHRGAVRPGTALRAAPLGGCGDAFDIVVNASASSLQGAEVPVDAAVLRPGGLALDMMYGAPARPFLRWAEAHGAVARDGLGMLVEQAAESFERWRGVRPATAPVLAALRERLAAGAKG